MIQSNYDMETLNAYVDGELSGIQAAALERELARNSNLARQVSDLMALKSTLKVIYDDLPCNVPDIDAAFATRDREHGQQRVPTPAKWRLPTLGLWPKLAMATVAAALVSVFLFGWLTTRPAPDAMMAQALIRHRQWVSEAGKNDNNGRAQLADFRAINGNIYIPDLAASELRIAKVVPFGQNGVQVGYKGTRDCHISLFIQPAPALVDLPLTAQRLGNSQTYRWRVNQLDYLLLAVGIDQNRLHLIATDVFQAARLGLPFDKKTRLALSLNRRTSQPCAV